MRIEGYKLAGEQKPRTVNARLIAHFNEYNCAVKMIGRFGLEVVDEKTGEKLYNSADPELWQKHRDGIIHEFGEWLVDRKNMKKLNDPSAGGAQFFPGDGGTYLANYLLFADAITKSPDPKTWWQSGVGLMNLLETTPSLGFQVFRLPAFSNNYYAKGDLHASAVWAIVPPEFTKYLLVEGSSQLKKYAKQIQTWKGDESPVHAELKKLAS